MPARGRGRGRGAAGTRACPARGPPRGAAAGGGAFGEDAQSGHWESTLLALRDRRYGLTAVKSTFKSMRVDSGTGRPPSTLSLNLLLDAMVRHNAKPALLDEVLEAFPPRLTPRDAWTLNTLLKGRFFHRYDRGAAKQAVDTVSAMGVRPDRVTFNTLFRIFGNTQHTQLEDEYLERMLAKGGGAPRPDAVTFTILVSAAAKRQDRRRVERLAGLAREELPVAGATPHAPGRFAALAAAASAFMDIGDLAAAEKHVRLAEDAAREGAAEGYGLGPDAVQAVARADGGLRAVAEGGGAEGGEELLAALFAHLEAMKAAGREIVDQRRGGGGRPGEARRGGGARKFKDKSARAGGGGGPVVLNALEVLGGGDPRRERRDERRRKREKTRSIALGKSREERILLLNLHMRLLRCRCDFTGALRLMAHATARQEEGLSADERCWSMLVDTACRAGDFRSGLAVCEKLADLRMLSPAVANPLIAAPLADAAAAAAPREDAAREAAAFAPPRGRAPTRPAAVEAAEGVIAAHHRVCKLLESASSVANYRTSATTCAALARSAAPWLFLGLLPGARTEKITIELHRPGTPAAGVNSVLRCWKETLSYLHKGDPECLAYLSQHFGLPIGRRRPAGAVDPLAAALLQWAEAYLTRLEGPKPQGGGQPNGRRPGPGARRPAAERLQGKALASRDTSSATNLRTLNLLLAGAAEVGDYAGARRILRRFQASVTPDAVSHRTLIRCAGRSGSLSAVLGEVQRSARSLRRGGGGARLDARTVAAVAMAYSDCGQPRLALRLAENACDSGQALHEATWLCICDGIARDRDRAAALKGDADFFKRLAESYLERCALLRGHGPAEGSVLGAVAATAAAVDAGDQWSVWWLDGRLRAAPKGVVPPRGRLFSALRATVHERAALALLQRRGEERAPEKALRMLEDAAGARLTVSSAAMNAILEEALARRGRSSAEEHRAFLAQLQRLAKSGKVEADPRTRALMVALLAERINTFAGSVRRGLDAIMSRSKQPEQTDAPPPPPPPLPPLPPGPDPGPDAGAGAAAAPRGSGAPPPPPAAVSNAQQ